jgi:DNA-binding transcriptional regulator YiaG
MAWQPVKQKDREAFAEQVKRWRGRKGMTQAEAATYLGMSRRTLETWEAARSVPKGFARTVILRLFEVDGQQDVSALLHGSKAVQRVPKRARKRTERTR